MQINKLSIALLLVANLMLSIQAFTLREYVAKVEEYQKTSIKAKNYLDNNKYKEANENYTILKQLLNEILEEAKKDIIDNKLVRAHLAKNDLFPSKSVYSTNKEAIESLNSTINVKCIIIDEILKNIPS